MPFFYGVECTPGVRQTQVQFVCTHTDIVQLCRRLVHKSMQPVNETTNTEVQNEQRHQPATSSGSRQKKVQDEIDSVFLPPHTHTHIYMCV